MNISAINTNFQLHNTQTPRKACCPQPQIQDTLSFGAKRQGNAFLKLLKALLEADPNRTRRLRNSDAPTQVLKGRRAAAQAGEKTSSVKKNF